MKQYITLAIMAMCAFNTMAQTVSVKDKQTAERLEWVSIIDAEKQILLTSDRNGKADISTLSDAKSIEFKLLGYKTMSYTWSQLQALNFEVLMPQDLLTLDQVVVSATRWNQNSRDVPSKLAVLKSKDIQFYNPQTSADLLTSSGKVYVQKSQQGGGSPMIRGFSTNRLLYAVDGVRMNTAIFRTGNIQNIISLDAFATESAEVLFGPGSVIYGSDALGGVMSFQTLTPRFSTESGKTLITGRATARYSTANQEKTAHFDIGFGSSNFASITSISYNNFGDLVMGSHGPDDYLRPTYVKRFGNRDSIIVNDNPKKQIPSAYSQYNVMQKFRWQANQNLEIQYGFHMSQTSDYGRYDRHTRVKSGLPRYGDWYYGPQKWMMHNLSLSHSSESSFYDKLTLRAAYQQFEESRHDRDFNKSILHIRNEKVNAYSLNLDFITAIDETQNIVYGAEYVLNKVKSEGIDRDVIKSTEQAGPSRYPQADWSSIALFANYQNRISEKVMFQAGTRHNIFSLNAEYDTRFYPFPFTTSSNKSGALTGSLGLVYKPEEKAVIHANISSGFRSPNVDDTGKVFDSTPGRVVVPNINLKAEYAYSAELGIVKILNDNIRVDLTAFYTFLDNAMVRRDFTLNGQDSLLYNGVMSKVEAIQNAAQANIYGIQAGIEIKPGGGFTILSDYNFQKGTEEVADGTKSPISQAPPSFGISRLRYKRNKIFVEINSQYSAGRTFEQLPQEEQGKTEIYAKDTNGKPYSPSWMIFSIVSQYKINSNLNVNFNIENITDRRYKTYSSGIAAAGRNFVISASATF